ncbi:regenerating islet-derived protein 3-gamma-like [Sorex araneus]|uniref:regenerating islet-derived protein 3-gamma-like n=1 Tax=Sorex araneus TaxID=42254 RepID=UPI002433DCC5|nr:regenerating islet-derived protein 3-gamma-like [Sorex araneus]
MEGRQPNGSSWEKNSLGYPDPGYCESLSTVSMSHSQINYKSLVIPDRTNFHKFHHYSYTVDYVSYHLIQSDRILPFMAIPSVAWILLSGLILPYQVKGEDLHKEELSPRISCPRGSVAYESLCYALFLSPKSWIDAVMACRERFQGHLVSVLTPSESYFVAYLIRNTGTKHENIWIGIHDPTEPNGGVWIWVNDDVMNYLAWEKNTTGHPLWTLGYCGTLAATSNYQQWRDYDCDQKLPYVCKFKG